MAITYEQAKKEAEKLIETKDQTILEVVEFDDSWVFLGGPRKANTTLYGTSNVEIYKDSGKIKNFPIPPIENLIKLDKGVIIFQL